MFVLNDPFVGGTHLPDITLVSRTALGYAVSRAHHSDVGGIERGRSRAISPEITRRVSSSRRCGSTTRCSTLVANVRNPGERRGDLRAQLAARGRAERRIEALWRAAAASGCATPWRAVAYAERLVGPHG